MHGDRGDTSLFLPSESSLDSFLFYAFVYLNAMVKILCRMCLLPSKQGTTCLRCRRCRERPLNTSTDT